MYKSVFCVLLVLDGFFITPTIGVFPIVKNESFNVPFVSSVNSSVEYIIEFAADSDVSTTKIVKWQYQINIFLQHSIPPVVKISSADATADAPLMVVVRGPKQVLSWQLPLMVDSEDVDIPFNTTSRILCYNSRIGLGKTLVFERFV